MTPHRLAWLALGILLTLPRAAAADELHYMIVFGSQRPSYFEANHTHSSAVFARAVCAEGGPRVVESFAISWMPQSMQVRCGKLRPEPGVNLDIHATLRWALGDGQRVARWGPFLISPELYRRGLRQRAHLESGEVFYKTVDTGFPTRRVSNCIHGVSDLAHEAPRLRICAPTRGQAASYFITLSLGKYLLNPRQKQEWLMDALGLGCYPIVARDLDDGNPTTRPLLRTFQSLRRLGFRASLRD
jgi:hypothetical protein